MPAGEDLLAGAWVSLVFLGLIAAAELWRRWGNPRPEWTRKFVHIGGGFVCIFLPFLVSSHWVVLAMAGGLEGLFLVTHYFGWLRSLHGVERKSLGIEYYPLVIYLIFLLAHQEPWMYVICVLVLAVSDSLAALIGSKYGQIHFEVEDDRKSVEGSLVFMVITFLAVQLPLVLWKAPPGAIPEPAICVLAALLVAMLVTLFEAVALRGSDNLWVPLGTYVVLTKILRKPLFEVAWQNVSFVVIFLVCGLVAWWTGAFNVGGTLVVILAVYASWSLGSFDWALPVLLGFMVYLVARELGAKTKAIKVRGVVRTLLPPFFVLVGANLAWPYDDRVYDYLYGPYLAGSIAVAARLAWNQIQWRQKLTAWRRPVIVTTITLATWAVMAVPAWLLQREVPLAAMLLTAVAVLPVLLLYDRLAGECPADDGHRPWIVVRFVLTAAVMGIMAALQSLSISPLWNPRW